MLFEYFKEGNIWFQFFIRKQSLELSVSLKKDYKKKDYFKKSLFFKMLNKLNTKISN